MARTFRKNAHHKHWLNKRLANREEYPDNILRHWDKINRGNDGAIRKYKREDKRGSYTHNLEEK